MRLHGRRDGVTMVFVAILMTVLLGFAGIAFDMSRLYVIKAQLQTTADASALAAAIEVMNGRPGNATAIALDYRTRNLVERREATLEAVDVEPGTWNFDVTAPDDGFTPLPDWTSAPVRAVRVTAHYPASLTLARIFGGPDPTLTAQSVAALGSVGASNCLMPFAIPYSNMLHELGYDPNNTSYDLSEADVSRLAAMTATKEMVLKVNSQTTDWDGNPIPGNFYPVRFGPVAHSDQVPISPGPESGGDAYRENLSGCTGSNEARVAIGDYLQIENGNMVGPTVQGVADYCGPLWSAGRLCDVIAPIWGGPTVSVGGPEAVPVKYIGAFVVTASSGGEIRGYFKSMGASGSFSPDAGPLTIAILVE